LFISLPLVAAPAPCREHDAPQTLVRFTERSDRNMEKHNITGEVTLLIGGLVNDDVIKSGPEPFVFSFAV
jgi:hypothetical protein